SARRSRPLNTFTKFGDGGEYIRAALDEALQLVERGTVGGDRDASTVHFPTAVSCRARGRALRALPSGRSFVPCLSSLTLLTYGATRKETPRRAETVSRAA